MSFINTDELFRLTNGGLDVILQYYPDAANCIGNNRKFKIREEKTPSATIKKLNDGNYVVTDFGLDQQPRNAIMVTMFEENCDFGTAVKLIAERFNILPEERKKELLKPEIKSRPALPEETEGYYKLNIGEFTEKDFKIIFADKVIDYVQKSAADKVKSDDWQTVLSRLCKSYHFYKLDSFEKLNHENRIVYTISSTEHFPIYVFEINDKVKKVYQPLSLEKDRRFTWLGGKAPNDFIFGEKQVSKKFDDLNSGSNEAVYNDLDEDEIKENRIVLLEEVIYCTGGSDALNVAALGYQVVWRNSESAKWKSNEVKRIKGYAKKFMILPDIDATGKKKAHEFCMENLETYYIQLPSSLAIRKDKNGSPCKDVRDYLRYHNWYDFKMLVQGSLQYQFWEMMPQFNKDGKKLKDSIVCNNTHLYFFLAQNGFYQFKTQGGQADIYIQISGNVVREVLPKQIRKYVNDFLASRNLPTELRNVFYKTTQLNSTSFENLPFIEIDFTDFDKEGQWMFFENKTFYISKDEIKEYKPGYVSKFVWEDEVINHKVNLLPDFFKITYDESNDDLSIELLNTSCLFFQYVINTTRMHWKVEKIGVPDGNGGLRTQLNSEEKKEQDLHLINRIFSIGYMLHRYKDPSRPWAVWAMENEVIEDSTSDGGSGKSILMKFPRYFMKSETLPARDQRLTENKHLLENINEHTDYVLVDDCHEYLNFNFFYPMITGEWHINPKNTRSFVIDYSMAPKIGFSSNYSPKNVDPSTERRLLYTVFSDFYHHGPSEKHPEAWSPKEEFGKNLFTDFNEEEWNLALNFGAQCVKFFLSFGTKIDPPMAKVTQRQLLGEMGDVFKSWADAFFGFPSDNLNKLDEELLKKMVMDECLQSNNLKWTSQKFVKALKAWCKFYGYKLNSPEYCNSGGKRIIREIEVNGKKTSAEFIRITSGMQPNKTGELPF